MTTVFRTCWLAWFGLCFAVEFLGWSVWYALGSFGVLEAWALARKEAGDTLSEQLWKFHTGADKGCLIAAWMIWACLEALALGVPEAKAGLHTLAFWAGRATLVVGMLGFLCLHLFFPTHKEDEPCH